MLIFVRENVPVLRDVLIFNNSVLYEKTFKPYSIFIVCSDIYFLRMLYISCHQRRNGRLIMKDGTEYVGRVKMPNGKTKKLRMRTTDGRKVKVQNTEVGVLGVWKKTHPETVSFLVCHPYYTIAPFSTKKKKKMKPRWMSLEATGKYVEFYALGANYSINSKGVFKVSSSIYITYLARKAGEEYAVEVGVYGGNKEYMRKQLMEYLSDDPALCSLIEDNEIEPDDFSELADKYRPQNSENMEEFPKMNL